MSSPQSCCDGTEQQASAQTTLPSKLYLTSLIASGCCCKGRGQALRGGMRSRAPVLGIFFNLGC